MITRAIDLDPHRMRPRGLSRIVDAFSSAWRLMFPAQRFLYERDRVPLPPLALRAAGPLFHSDRTFHKFAITDVAMIERHTEVAGKHILDFGCGAGRLFFGFRCRNEPGSYLGVDVRRDVIDWVQRTITAKSGRFAFVWRDVENERYNPDGALANDAWAESLERTFDVVYCYSVLSHLIEADATAALNLFADCMRKDSLIFLTAFIGEQSETIAINPNDADIVIRGPLHVVRYRPDYFRDTLLRRFAIVAEYPAVATDGQSLFVLRPR
jgi:SAM-dependent methyltransferase